MKSLRIVTLAIAAIVSFSANAAAQELAVNPPDINGKLNALVEQKIDALIERNEMNSNHADAQKEALKSSEQLPDVSQHHYIYVISDSRK